MTEFAHARRDDPDTSHLAADTIRPAVPTIRLQVKNYAHEHFEFTDDELVHAFPDSPESSYRKRRSELTEQGWIVDTGKRRANGDGNLCIVWQHRDHHPDPPPLKTKSGKASKETKAEAQSYVPQLRNYARQMRGEGRGAFANDLERAAELIAQLAG